LKKKISTLYVLAVGVVTVLTLAYTTFVEMPSMTNTSDGVPYLSSPVLNPDTGEAVDLGVLVRHYQGD